MFVMEIFRITCCMASSVTYRCLIYFNLL